MKYFRYMVIAVLVAVTFYMAADYYSKMAVTQNQDLLFQNCVISTLMAGDFDSEYTYSEIKKHGNFGIGTFNALDGEMIALEDNFYQIRSDGRVYPVLNTMKSPFSAVTFFEADKTIMIRGSMSYSELKAYIDSYIPSKSIIQAIHISGEFDYIKCRSVYKQSKPYPNLEDALKNQPEFEFKTISGDLVGFRCPDFMQGVNVAGYHLHFINSERTGGGHLLDCVIKNVIIQIDNTEDLYVKLSE
ncbi:acetolactate decarboxylase [Thermoproteota archaeon]